ncbi:MAG: NUDIX hydrolase [Candidatus Eremiobacteraeota bacterium]|nr:NUDIX hydrolase [Candidatus Eremiobacteraeota bacterium]
MNRFQRISQQRLYANPWVALEIHQINHPNGTAGEHVLVVTPRAAAALIVDDDDLLFTRQMRFGAQTDVLELVKGGAQEDESELQCAQRETREELGVVANTWEPMGFLYEIPSILDKPVHLFLATNIYHVDTEFEAVETIELVRVPRRLAFAAAAAGEISDAITAGALLRYGLISGYLSPKN